MRDTGRPLLVCLILKFPVKPGLVFHLCLHTGRSPAQVRLVPGEPGRPEIQTQVSSPTRSSSNVRSVPFCGRTTTNFLNCHSELFQRDLLRGVCVSHPDEESHQLLSSASCCLFQHSNYLSVTMQSGKATDGRHSETTSPCQQLAERVEPRCIYQSFLDATPRPGRRGTLRVRGGRVLLSPALPPLPRVSPQSRAPRARRHHRETEGNNCRMGGKKERSPQVSRVAATRQRMRSSYTALTC